MLEAGCGAGRVTLGLWALGYRHLTAFDFSEELLDQALSLAAERRASTIRFLHADATNLRACRAVSDTSGHPAAALPPPSGLTPPGAAREAPPAIPDELPPFRSAPAPDYFHVLREESFAGALFMFNGLMQIPGRSNRRAALRELHRVCLPAAPLLFTTHDRDSSPEERAWWREEAGRWRRGRQDPRLVEFGDRYFTDEAGRTFMHLPDRAEVLADLAATGWRHEFDAMRTEIARENHAVREFSDECRFWLARREP